MIRDAMFEGLLKSYPCSVAENTLRSYGRKYGILAITGISLTGIGGIALLLDHLWCQYATTSFETLVQRYIDAEGELKSVKKTDKKSSGVYQQANDAYNKAGHEIALRLADHKFHTDALMDRDIKLNKIAYSLIRKSAKKNGIKNSSAANDLKYYMERSLFFSSSLNLIRRLLYLAT